MDTNDVRLVGKRSNAPLYLLLALVLLGLLGYFFWMQNRDERAPEQQAQEQGQDADNVGDIAGIYAVANAADLHNENVDLDGVTVTSVISDRLFYVSQGVQEQQLLVYLADRLDEGAAEGAVRIQQGQVLNIDGELKASAETDIEVGESYTEAEAQAVREERVFLSVTDTNG